MAISNLDRSDAPANASRDQQEPRQFESEEGRTSSGPGDSRRSTMNMHSTFSVGPSRTFPVWFSSTMNWAKARSDWRAAYDEHDRLAEQLGDGAVETKQASDLEYAALDRLLSMPATTTMEVRDKLAIIEERGVDSGWTEDWPKIMAQVRRDMINMWRPNASPAIAAAFEGWAEAHRAHCMDTIGEDGHDNALFEASMRAMDALLQLPCTTPGDFLVKAYVGLVFDVGPKHDGANVTSPFEVDESDIFGGAMEESLSSAMLRDLSACDLGRCMMALGRVDFDARAWLEAAKRCGQPCTLVINPDGTRCFWTGDLRDDDLQGMLQKLTAGGLDDVARERVSAICDAIEENYPDIIVDLRKAELA